MNLRFGRHYSVEEAREMVIQLKAWFNEVNVLTVRIRKIGEQFAPQLKGGADLSGREVSGQFRGKFRVQSILGEFISRKIQIKNLPRGMIDFPAPLNEREIFLC